MAGNINPNVLRQTAPINEMNGPRSGIIVDITTVNVCKQNSYVFELKRFRKSFATHSPLKLLGKHIQP